MREIYIFRHCKPEFKNGTLVCLGKNTNPPLCIEGRQMADRYKVCISKKSISAFYSSPMKRCKETAALISAGRISVCEEPLLTELDSGEWEDLSHEEIAEAYPEIWTARLCGEHIPPPMGESDEHGYIRMKAALLKILAETSGNIAIVSHGALINAFCRFCKIQKHANICDGKIRWGNVTVLLFDGNNFILTAKNIVPISIPSEEYSDRLFSLYSVPKNVRAHCSAVQKKALEMANILADHGVCMDLFAVSAGAYLHDILRKCPNHAESGASLLRQRGFLTTGEIILYHEGGFIDTAFDEKKVVYLADKYICETDLVTIDERFNASFSKCKDECAIRIHALRKKEALDIEKQFKYLTEETQDNYEESIKKT